jgi:hypothetical protein
MRESTRPVVPTATWQALRREGTAAAATQRDGGRRRGELRLRGRRHSGRILQDLRLRAAFLAALAALAGGALRPLHGCPGAGLRGRTLSPPPPCIAHLRSCFSSSSTGRPPMKVAQVRPGGGRAAAASPTASLA